jgi:hypothetical protein
MPVDAEVDRDETLLLVEIRPVDSEPTPVESEATLLTVVLATA